MKQIFFISSLILCTFLISCGGGKMTFDNIQNQADCSAKGGYWYNGKCWNDFEDEGISKSDIDKVVEEEMEVISKSDVRFNKQTYPLTFFFPEMDEKTIIFITMFKDGEGTKSIVQEVEKKKLKEGATISSPAMLMNGDLMEMSEDENASEMSSLLGLGDLDIIVNNIDELDLQFKGTFVNPDNQKEYDISYKSSEAILGAGSSEMEVKGDEVHINGELGTKSYYQLKNIIENHPEVKTAVLGTINGSVNDAVNMHTGRILREAGLNTKVLSNSSIASGGVDLFCAGKERIVEKGAKIGIHSWCCLGDLTAADIPKDHPAHKYQIEFFTMCMGKPSGPNFYFHTLEAAPFDGIHWMSDEDIQKWKVSTQFVK